MVNFNPIDKDYIVSWQSDQENTKEIILPVCDKPYHKIKENMPLGEKLENLWNYPLNIIISLTPLFLWFQAFGCTHVGCAIRVLFDASFSRITSEHTRETGRSSVKTVAKLSHRRAPWKDTCLYIWSKKQILIPTKHEIGSNNVSEPESESIFIYCR